VSTGPATAAHPAAPAGFQVRDDEELGYAASTAHGTLAYDDETAGAVVGVVHRRRGALGGAH
jgi:hypothetical protein